MPKGPGPKPVWMIEWANGEPTYDRYEVSAWTLAQAVAKATAMERRKPRGERYPRSVYLRSVKLTAAPVA